MHPYNIIGAENIKNAFASLVEISNANGYEIKMNEEGLNHTAIIYCATYWRNNNSIISCCCL